MNTLWFKTSHLIKIDCKMPYNHLTHTVTPPGTMNFRLDKSGRDPGS